MRQMRRTKLSGWLHAIGRVWWAALVLIHVPLFIKSCMGVLDGTGGSIEAAIALAITLAVFSLKLIDAPFLRLGGRHTTAISFLLICAVVHHEAVVSADATLTWQVPAIVATALGAAAMWRLRSSARRLSELWRIILRALLRAVDAILARHRVAIDLARRRPSLCALPPPRSPRAPPF